MRRLIICCWYLALSSCLFSLPLEPIAQGGDIRPTASCQLITSVELGELEPSNIRDLISRLPTAESVANASRQTKEWQGVFLPSTQRNWNFRYQPASFRKTQQRSVLPCGHCNSFAKPADAPATIKPRTTIRTAGFRKKPKTSPWFNNSSAIAMLNVRMHWIKYEVESAIADSATRARELPIWVLHWFTNRFCPLY